MGGAAIQTVQVLICIDLRTEGSDLIYGAQISSPCGKEILIIRRFHTACGINLTCEVLGRRLWTECCALIGTLDLIEQGT